MVATRFLDEFGRADGFADYNAFAEFWAANHGVNEFLGVIIKWEPLS